MRRGARHAAPPPCIPGRQDLGWGAGCWARSGCRSRFQCLCPVETVGKGKGQRKVTWGAGTGSQQPGLPVLITSACGHPGNRALWATACEGTVTSPSYVTHGHTTVPLHLPSSLSRNRFALSHLFTDTLLSVPPVICLTPSQAGVGPLQALTGAQIHSHSPCRSLGPPEPGCQQSQP